MTETTIEARANAATKGPWEPRDVSPFGDGILIDTVHDGLRGAIASVVNPARFMSFVRQQEEKDSQTRANALFIQHAREDIPALCATVKHLRELADTRSDLIAAKAAHVDQLQSQLEQLRAENVSLRGRVLELETEIDTKRGYL